MSEADEKHGLLNAWQFDGNGGGRNAWRNL